MDKEIIIKICKRHIILMEKTCATLGHIVQGISQEEATTLRDGADGWTIVEIVCHLRDFDGFFHHRAQMMVEQDNPLLPAYDHEALAIERQYNSQNLADTYAELRESRQRFVDFFKGLDDVQWQRTGVHPEAGPFDMLGSAMQVGIHDADHLEQIMRVLAQRDA